MHVSLVFWLSFDSIGDTLIYIHVYLVSFISASEKRGLCQVCVNALHVYWHIYPRHQVIVVVMWFLTYVHV